jgi:hypothetical protein
MVTCIGQGRETIRIGQDTFEQQMPRLPDSRVASREQNAGELLGLKDGEAEEAGLGSEPPAVG